MSDPRIGETLAVDPSIRSAGVALFRGGVLVAADRIRVPDDGALGERCLRMGHAICAWAVVQQRACPQTLVIEWPQIYTSDKSEGDPNDLPGLAGVAMATAGALSVAVSGRLPEPMGLIQFLPAEWAGQLPKSKTRKKASPREARIRSRLSAAESALLPAQHDAVDAVGIGLAALGRFQRLRVFAGAV